MVVAVVVVSMAVLVALTVWVAAKLDNWQGARFPRKRRGGRNCPSCGGFFSRVVESDDRLNGYRECRGCHFTWDPEAR
ncbi:hypothetical protein SAMN06297387_101513 [Streptomyces zhaozhouensis]|uniref:Uncharacterized protein n=1 Tax=Streptomyces zhaozhouensis TaxID=1300267 RepID=A0A286DKQ6_9ACTN|nr:hypothetical protein [Streptomyces zhaozhouensis]SOD59163.1 hypothetical protein SAMN06297387_101513 [Streptomyces zhaozhouensis]